MKKPNKEKMSVKKKIAVIIGCIGGIAVLALLAGYLVINGYLSKIQYDPGAASMVSSIAPDTESGVSSDSPQNKIDELNKQIEDNMKNNSEPLMYDNNVFNLLLIGSDTRAENGRGRSDSMILISINKKTSKIIETSFLRDIYVKIPGVENGNRLNAAYAFGGPALLLDTIQQNFKIKVDKYVAVDFYSFMDIVDKVGGVTINISKEEADSANYSVRELNKLKGLPLDDGLFTASGTQKMNGKQALAFARIRHVGNGDFGRTDRQRLVLDQVISKIKTLNVMELNNLLNTLLPQVTTNLSKGELFSMVLSLPSYSKYQAVSWHIPQNDAFSYVTVRQMSVLDIDFTKCIQRIKTEIYG